MPACSDDAFFGMSTTPAAGPATSETRQFRRFLPAIIGAAVATALYWVSLRGTYVYDDLDILLRDDRIADPSQWLRYWTESYNYNADNLYRPITSLSYAIQWWLHGDRPWAFHLVNVLLNAGVTACLAEFVRRLAGFVPALIVALLFAAHPIHVEAVANIVGRAELLCALGMFGAMLLALRPLTPARAVAITACCLLSLLSKEQGIFTPLLLLILAMLRSGFAPAPLPPPAPRALAGRRTLVLLLCWSLAGYIVWREHILKFFWDRNFLDWTMNPMVQSAYNPHGGSTGADALLMPLALLGRYTALLLFPLRLSPDYGGKVIGWSASAADPYLYLGIAAVVLWSLLLWRAIRGRSVLATLALIGLALTYGLVSNLVMIIGTNFGERLMYTPSAFLLILLAIALARLPRPALAGVMSVLLALAAIRTETYALRWNDRLSFIEQSLAEQPNSIRLRIQLGEELRDRGRFEEAARVAAEGRRLYPEYFEIWVQSGEIALDLGRLDEAEQFLLTAGHIRPGAKVAAWLTKVAEARAATRPATTQASRAG
jgi:hypothetical protein